MRGWKASVQDVLGEYAGFALTDIDEFTVRIVRGTVEIWASSNGPVLYERFAYHHGEGCHADTEPWCHHCGRSIDA